MRRTNTISSGLAVTVAASITALLSTGCGFTSNSKGAPTIGPAFHGVVMGGHNPIIGATIKIYSTGNADGTNAATYGVGNLLQEANQVGPAAGDDTDAGGNFTFVGGYSCPAGQFAYIVNSGGNTGGNVENPAAMLVAALGRCEDLYNGTTYTGGRFIFMDEVTTVAAAYALGSFATVTGTDKSMVVGIGAPDTNNSTVGSVTGAAGLLHAFQNAANMVDVFGDGNARTNLISNPSGAVPQQLIHAIANSLVACVNSSGGSTACNTLFNATAINGTLPTNTFQAMINLAQNPTLEPTISGTTSSPTAFFNIATPQTSVYSPTLTAAPADYSIAFNFPRGTGSGTNIQGLQYPISIGIDANDTAFIGNQSGAASTASNLAAFSSDGMLLGITTNNTTFPNQPSIAIDALDRVDVLTGVNTTPVLRYASNSGTLSSTPDMITNDPSFGASTVGAVDKFNNLWFGTNQAGANNLFEVLSGAGTAALITSSPNIPLGIAVDPNQNIWITDSDPTAANSISVLKNVNTVSNPSYATPLLTKTLSGTSASGIAFASNAVANKPYIAYISSAAGTPGLNPATPVIGGGGVAVTALSVAAIISGSPAPFTAPIHSQGDGAGKIWVADTAKVMMTIPNTTTSSKSTTVRLNPCLPIGTTNTTCANAANAPTAVGIDSTGSVWVTDSSGGNVFQIIGSATPIWPLLSRGLLTKP
jgi:hypothetical protein